MPCLVDIPGRSALLQRENEAEESREGTGRNRERGHCSQAVLYDRRTNFIKKKRKKEMWTQRSLDQGNTKTQQDKQQIL